MEESAARGARSTSRQGRDQEKITEQRERMPAACSAGIFLAKIAPALDMAGIFFSAARSAMCMARIFSAEKIIFIGIAVMSEKIIFFGIARATPSVTGGFICVAAFKIYVAAKFMCTFIIFFDIAAASMRISSIFSS